MQSMNALKNFAQAWDVDGIANHFQITFKKLDKQKQAYFG